MAGGNAGFTQFLTFPWARQLVLAPDETVLLEVPHDKRGAYVLGAAGVLAFTGFALWSLVRGSEPSPAWMLAALVPAALAGAVLPSWRSVVTTDRVIVSSSLRTRELRLADVATCGWRGRTLSLEPRGGGRPVRVRFVRDRAAVDERLKDAGLTPGTRG